MTWETRKRRGYPICEDWQQGRCLGPADLAALQDGERVSVTWGGGNGPHTYTAKRSGEDVLACVPELPDGYPGAIYSQAWANAAGLAVWVERA